jgi:hypothetical protein
VTREALVAWLTGPSRDLRNLRSVHRGRIGKRIIILLDGTWNDTGFGPYYSNVVRKCEDFDASGSSGRPFSGTSLGGETKAKGDAKAKKLIDGA